MSKTQDIVWPSGSAFLPRLSATGSRGFRLNLELFGPLTTDPVGRHWSLLGAPDSSLVCFSWKRKSEKKKKKKKFRKIDRAVTTRPTHKPPENFKSLPNAGTNIAADTTRIHPVRQDLVGRYWWGCVCVCEPKPERQKDQGRGDKREECRLGLIRALLSGLWFLSITESGTKERDGGVWLEFQRALASASLSSLGLVCLVLFFFFPPLQIVGLVSAIRGEKRLSVNQNNIDFSFAAFISSR